MLNNLNDYHIILGSKSPRRKHLLAELDLNFEVQIIDTDESFPADMSIDEVAEYLAQKKALPFEAGLNNNKLVITADTIVALGNEILGKPADYNDAFEMLKKLSGKPHRVLTGVCISTKNKQHSFTAETTVYFKKLSDNEITYYLNQFEPYDKAGSYGIQEWIGYIAIERIEGSYFNVMGLPVQHLYEELQKF
jgi:septum formation protein